MLNVTDLIENGCTVFVCRPEGIDGFNTDTKGFREIAEIYANRFESDGMRRIRKETGYTDTVDLACESVSRDFTAARSVLEQDGFKCDVAVAINPMARPEMIAAALYRVFPLIMGYMEQNKDHILECIRKTESPKAVMPVIAMGWSNEDAIKFTQEAKALPNTNKEIDLATVSTDTMIQ